MPHPYTIRVDNSGADPIAFICEWGDALHCLEISITCGLMDTTCPNGGCSLFGNPKHWDIFDVCPTTTNGDVNISDVEPSDTFIFRVKDEDGNVTCEINIGGWELAFYSTGPYIVNLTDEGRASICW